MFQPPPPAGPVVPQAPQASQVPQAPQGKPFVHLNWSNFNPEFSGKPDEDADHSWPSDASMGGTSDLGMPDCKCQADLTSDCKCQPDLM